MIAATGKLIWGYPGKDERAGEVGGQPDVGRAMAAIAIRAPRRVFFRAGHP